MTFDLAPNAYSICAAPRPQVEFKRRPISIRAIQFAVADYFDLHIDEILSARRSRRVAWPRQIAMYLAKELTPNSLPMIGRQFGNRDHTTIIHGINAVTRRWAILGDAVEDIRETLTADRRPTFSFRMEALAA